MARRRPLAILATCDGRVDGSRQEAAAGFAPMEISNPLRTILRISSITEQENL